VSLAHGPMDHNGDGDPPVHCGMGTQGGGVAHQSCMCGRFQVLGFAATVPREKG
jgi:hypothetical protein